jgi:hypothetical protein
MRKDVIVKGLFELRLYGAYRMQRDVGEAAAADHIAMKRVTDS